MTKAEQVERLNHEILRVINAIVKTIKAERGLALDQQLDNLATEETRAKIEVALTNNLEEYEERKLECNPDAYDLAADLTRDMQADPRWRKKILVIRSRLERDFNVESFISLIVVDYRIPHRPQTQNSEPLSPYSLSDRDMKFLRSLKINPV